MSLSFCRIWSDFGGILAAEAAATEAWLRCSWWSGETMGLDTEMERNAVKAARQQFAEALERHNLMRAFYSLDAAVIDDLISAAIVGFSAGMRRQRDDIPF